MRSWSRLPTNGWSSFVRHGFLPEGEGSQKALQEILRREEARHPGLQLPRTATDKYVTKKDALAELADQLPFVKAYVEYKEVAEAAQHVPRQDEPPRAASIIRCFENHRPHVILRRHQRPKPAT